MKKYNFFKNSKYAFEGVIELLKEKAFLIEISFIIPLFIALFFLDLTPIQKSLMGGSLFIILIAEALNTAIETSVDLVTKDFNILAKRAKDCASAGVLFSITLAIFIWIVNLI
jgi:diacylglycerol kinase (ATP)